MAEEKVTSAAEEMAKTAEKPSAEKKTKTAEKKPVAEKKPAAEKKAAKPAAEKAEQEKPAPEKKPAAKKADGKTVSIKAKSKKSKKDDAPQKGQVKIVMRRGLSGRTKAQIAVANSLGLRSVGDVTFQPDNEATKGKIGKISFLLDVSKA